MGKGKIKIPAGKGFITCSSLGNLYGCGYGTMLDIYESYKGAPKKDFTEEQLKSMEFGTKFEDAVVKFFTYKTNIFTLFVKQYYSSWSNPRPKKSIIAI